MTTNVQSVFYSLYSLPSPSLMSLSREFFQLLSQELVNPQYALFYSSNGLHRPSPHSSVNPSHLNYFTLCGEILARMLCDSKSNRALLIASFSSRGH